MSKECVIVILDGEPKLSKDCVIIIWNVRSH